jgi:poly(A) polymerase
VNALAYDLGRDVLIDPHGGLADLHAATLRAVGDPGLRFGEDLSRLLRGIRFAAQLGFSLEEKTWIALCVRIGEINKKRIVNGEETFVVPRETVGVELGKAFGAHPGVAAELLQKSGAFAELLPEVDSLVREDPTYLEPLNRLPAGTLHAALAILLRAVPVGQVASLVSQVGLDTLPRESPLRVTGADVAWLVEKIAAGPADANLMRPIDFERAFMNGHARAHFAVLDALGRTEEAKAARARADKMRSYFGTAPGEKIPALVSGNDAIAAGLVPGPHIRLALERVRDAQLEGKLKTRAQALTYLKNHLEE